MTIEVSISPSISQCFNSAANAIVHESFHLHFIAKDDDCRKIWTIAIRDESGDLKRYNSIQQALMEATEKLPEYNVSC